MSVCVRLCGKKSRKERKRIFLFLRIDCGDICDVTVYMCVSRHSVDHSVFNPLLHRPHRSQVATSTIRRIPEGGGETEGKQEIGIVGERDKEIRHEEEDKTTGRQKS